MNLDILKIIWEFWRIIFYISSEILEAASESQQICL
jgi:hypothetical protein